MNEWMDRYLYLNTVFYQIVIQDGWMDGSWDAYLASLAVFSGADGIITNVAKEREPGIEIIERTPYSLIITGYNSYTLIYLLRNYNV